MVLLANLSSEAIRCRFSLCNQSALVIKRTRSTLTTTYVYKHEGCSPIEREIGDTSLARSRTCENGHELTLEKWLVRMLEVSHQSVPH